MQQRVNNISYLAVSKTNLNSLSTIYKDTVAIPKGAHIISVMLELKDSEGTGEVTVTLCKAKLNFFENVTLDGAAANSKFLTSSIHAQASDNDTVAVQLNTGSFTKGELVVKVLYFLPSQVLTEF